MSGSVRTVLLVLLAVVLGGFWLRSHDARVRATAELVKKDAALDSMARTLSEHERTRMEYRRRTDSLVAVTDSVIRRDSLLADSLKTAGTVRYVELRGLLEPAIRPMLDSLQATHAKEVEAKDSVIVSLNGVVARLMGERQASDSLILGYRQALSLALVQRDGWKHQAGRKDWLACGPMAGVTLKGLGFGAGCVIPLL